MNFAPGQEVIVISGGPRMTVSKVEGDTVHCYWMEKKGTGRVKQHDDFPAVVLKLAPPLGSGVAIASFRGR